MYNLTANQQKVFDFLKNYYLQNGVSPTMQEVAIALHKSIPTVQGYFKELEIKGAIAKTANKSRSIVIAELENQKTEVIPVMGTISAGDGIFVEETFEETIDVPEEWVKGSTYDYYALKVNGFSMWEDGIIDGDLVIIRKQSFANNGDRVVGIIHDDGDEKATLKKYNDRDPENIILEPSNPELKPIEVPRNLFEIRGKFIGLIRI